MGRLSWPNKYNSEVLTCGVDWSPRLQNLETLAADTGVFTPLEDSDITIDSTVIDGTTTTCQVSGGTVGTHWVMATVETSGGRTLEEICTFEVLRES